MSYKENRVEKRRRRLEREAEDMFQITEHAGQIWFTYNSCLFAPCFLCGCETASEAVGLLRTIRNNYVERHIKDTSIWGRLFAVE